MYSIFKEEQINLVSSPYPFYIIKNDIYPHQFRRHNMHWHNNLELLYFIEGSAEIIYGTDVITAEKGELVIINIDVPHNIKPITAHSKYYCMIFGRDFYLQITENKKYTFNRHIKNANFAFTYMQSIINEQEKPIVGSNMKIHADAMLMLIELMRYHCNNSAISENTMSKNNIQIVMRAIDYIKSRYAENISIDDICNHINFSKYYFCHCFKNVLGMTAIEYINAYRCECAYRLLSSGQANVAEAALLVGFSNSGYFCRVYKQITGHSPSQDIIKL